MSIQMTNLKYDKTFKIPYGGEILRYGIIWGNDKIVFIKAGVPKDVEEDNKKTKGKYVDKYLIMAHRVRNRIGATVICASNCDLSGEIQLEADKLFIENVILNKGFVNYELHFVGTSDGGEHSLKLSQQFPKTVKFLGINSSWSTTDTFLDIIQSLPHVKKIFVYGAWDVDFDDIVPKLNALACDNLEITVLDGVDHDFTDKVDDFIALVDLL